MTTRNFTVPSCLAVSLMIAAAMFGARESQAAAKCKAAEWRGVTAVAGEMLNGVDGDTAHIKLRGLDYSVRFVNIDTPETHYNGLSQGVWGERAAARAAELLPVGTQVVVHINPAEPCDANQRMLGRVFKGSMDINLQMVQEGWAVNYCIWPALDCEQFAHVAQASIDAERGIFSRNSGVMLPYEWRRQQSGRPHDKFVGSVFTREVHQPGYVDRIPVADRIFFFKQTDIQAPYHLVD